MLPEHIFDKLQIAGPLPSIDLKKSILCQGCRRVIDVVAKKNSKVCPTCFGLASSVANNMRFVGAFLATENGVDVWVGDRGFAWENYPVNTNSYRLEVSPDWISRAMQAVLRHEVTEPYVFYLKTDNKPSVEVSDMKVNIDSDLIFISGPKKIILKTGRYRDPSMISRSHARSLDASADGNDALLYRTIQGARKTWNM